MLYYGLLIFLKSSFRKTIQVSNSLDQIRHFVEPDLGPNCLQKLGRYKELQDMFLVHERTYVHETIILSTQIYLFWLIMKLFFFVLFFSLTVQLLLTQTSDNSKLNHWSHRFIVIENQLHTYSDTYGPRREKKCLRGLRTTKVQTRLFSAFIICFWESSITKLATSKISIF